MKIFVSVDEINRNRVSANLVSEHPMPGGPVGVSQVQKAKGYERNDKGKLVEYADYVFSSQRIQPVTGVEIQESFVSGVVSFIFKNGDVISGILSSHNVGVASIIDNSPDKKIEVGTIIFRGTNSTSAESNTLDKKFKARVYTYKGYLVYDFK